MAEHDSRTTSSFGIVLGHLVFGGTCGPLDGPSPSSLPRVPSMRSDQKVKVLWERRSHRSRADRKAPSVRASLKEAASRIHASTYRNRLRGVAPQGEWAGTHEALAIKRVGRRAGDGVVKATSLTWGDLASRLKGRRREAEREVSKGRSSAAEAGKGPGRFGRVKDRTEGRANRP